MIFDQFSSHFYQFYQISTKYSMITKTLFHNVCQFPFIKEIFFMMFNQVSSFLIIPRTFYKNNFGQLSALFTHFYEILTTFSMTYNLGQLLPTFQRFFRDFLYFFQFLSNFYNFFLITLFSTILKIKSNFYLRFNSFSTFLINF